MVLTLLSIFLNWSAFGWTWLVGWACMSFVWCVFGLILVLGLTDPDRESSLIVSEAWLLYGEGGLAPPGPLAQWDRWRLKAVHLEQGVIRKRLLLDDGGYHVEIGESLSDSDRIWLAEVIRAWIPPPKPTQLSPESEGQPIPEET